MPDVIKHKEHARFSASGKTFFFNEGRAKNGSPYLTINALYGKGNRERVILFEPHMMEFSRKLAQSIEAITGFGMQKASAGPTIPEGCPECSSSPKTWITRRELDDSYWVIFCGECKTIIKESIVDGCPDMERLV
jgi:hypothetical protein